MHVAGMGSVGDNTNGDPKLRIPRVDLSTHTLQTIDYAHHEVHSGSAYTCGLVTALDAFDIASPMSFLVTTPNTAKWAHMSWAFNAALAGVLEVFEDNGVIGEFNVSGGTGVTPINHNRNSANASGLTITHTPTITAADPAARLLADVIGGAFVGGSLSHAHELILKQNTAYLFRATSYVDDSEGSLRLDWYEHTDKT